MDRIKPQYEPATKGDLADVVVAAVADLASKDDLKQYATKEDLAAVEQRLNRRIDDLATKDELDGLEAQFIQWRKETQTDLQELKDMVRQLLP